MAGRVRQEDAIMAKKKKKGAQHPGPHKYQRIKWRSRKADGEPYVIFKCMLPGCTHYVPRDLVVGNETICWKCGRTFQMAYAHTYLAKPHCVYCTKGRQEGGSCSRRRDC
jgi:hypothetical protein